MPAQIKIFLLFVILQSLYFVFYQCQSFPFQRLARQSEFACGKKRIKIFIYVFFRHLSLYKITKFTKEFSSVFAGSFFYHLLVIFPAIHKKVMNVVYVSSRNAARFVESVSNSRKFVGKHRFFRLACQNPVYLQKSLRPVLAGVKKRKRSVNF